MIIAMQGVPGSGKTTWAKEHTSKINGDFLRVSRDDIRRMIHGQAYVPYYEGLVKQLRDNLIHELLMSNWTVIVDETCVKGTEELEQMAKNYGTEFKVHKMDTPLQVCIERDSKRPEPVGAEIITRMWEELHG